MTTRDATVAALVRTSRRLSRSVAALRFGGVVAAVYNPLDYARTPHEMYLAMARPRPRALFLGMNPGPYGMAQTGVPFGEVAAVREFLGIDASVKRPRQEHAKRPIEGFACSRSEVSGRRFWGLMAAEFATRSAFFARAFVWNWCPLAFMTESGANLTPDKLPRAEQDAVGEACDEALRAVVSALNPTMIIGVGAFASDRAREALRVSVPAIDLPIATVLHPSPASPAANRGWDAAARKQLVACGFLRDA
ncbi:MAG: single-stranded DNA-binding protein [Limnohabitans sp.]|nr:single-stranded DNA-binding protein [Limnohabitans sp.]